MDKFRSLALFFLFLLLLLSACTPAAMPTKQHRLRVIDAETGAPVPGAVVALHYQPSMPDAPEPNHPRSTADDQGALTIQSRTRPLIWQAQAQNYIEQRLSNNAGDLPMRYAAHAQDGYNGVIHLYYLPEPQLSILIDDGYTGPVTINLQPAPGFAFVLVDEINVTFAAVDPEASYVQEEPGSRTFTERASAKGTIDLVVTPLLYDIQIENLQIQDGTGVLPHRDIANPEDQERGFWGTVTDDHKRLHHQIRLFVGTLADYQAFLQSAQ
jgi:hypothetical protein